MRKVIVSAAAVLSMSSSIGSAATYRFDFEGLFATPNTGARSSLTLRTDGLTAFLEREGNDRFDIVDTDDGGAPVPSRFGDRALSPFADEQSSTPFVLTFSRPVDSVRLEAGDFGADTPDEVRLDAFRTDRRFFTRVDTDRVLIPTLDPTNNPYNSRTLSVRSEGNIGRVEFIGGTRDFPHSVYYDNIFVTAEDRFSEVASAPFNARPLRGYDMAEVSLDFSDRAFRIEYDIGFTGAYDTLLAYRLEDSFRAGLERYWGGVEIEDSVTREEFDVDFDVSFGRASSATDARYDIVVDLVAGGSPEGPSKGTRTDMLNFFLGDYTNRQWEWVFAHEFGHYMGLCDEYVDENGNAASCRYDWSDLGFSERDLCDNRSGSRCSSIMASLGKYPGQEHYEKIFENVINESGAQFGFAPPIGDDLLLFPDDGTTPGMNPNGSVPIDIAPVPLPASWLLLLAGLGSVAAARAVRKDRSLKEEPGEIAAPS